MNTLHILLPYDYVISHVSLTWSDILFALEHGLMAKKAAVEYAYHVIGKEAKPTQTVLALAWVHHEEEVDFYLNELTNQIVEQKDDIPQKKFLYLLLNWVFEHKEQFSDPLQMVETIYADFDYPEEISNFVRYMPLSQPVSLLLERKVARMERLFNNWEVYLKTKKIEIFK